jgi:small conductance mechanosensitive channel
MPEASPTPSSVESAAVHEAIDLIQRHATTLIASCIILITAYLFAAWSRRIVLRACERAEIDTTLARFVAKLSRWLILIVAITVVLNRFGIETASFSVLIGTVGLAVSLAFQGTLSNFAAGVMLMVFRPYKIGDTINAAGQVGTVDEVDLFSTTIDTVDNRRVFVPNSMIFGAVITNNSAHPLRRVDVQIVLQHGVDSDIARSALVRAATQVRGRSGEAPDAFIQDITAVGVAWLVYVWGPSEDVVKLRRDLLQEVHQGVLAANLPFAVSNNPPGS